MKSFFIVPFANNNRSFGRMALDNFFDTTFLRTMYLPYTLNTQVVQKDPFNFNPAYCHDLDFDWDS